MWWCSSFPIYVSRNCTSLGGPPRFCMHRKLAFFYHQQNVQPRGQQHPSKAAGCPDRKNEIISNNCLYGIHAKRGVCYGASAPRGRGKEEAAPRKANQERDDCGWSENAMQKSRSGHPRNFGTKQKFLSHCTRSALILLLSVGRRT